MNIEKIVKCPNCGSEIEEMTLEVQCYVTVIWEESEQQYLAKRGSFNLWELEEYRCPHCNSHNTFDDEESE
jgi:DNA-directed RNA polymerase subunit RPC12/RpoP